ncbi:ComEC/Rec2 family competence protein [bacterium]|nr:ComEC/Rec2 family competence protein [bacterium]
MAAFYAFPGAAGAALAAAVGLGGFFLVLLALPSDSGRSSAAGGRRVSCARAGLALSLGLAWGAAALVAEGAVAPPPELARLRAVRFEGVVAVDSRRTSTGNTVMTIALTSATLRAPGFSVRLERPRSSSRIRLVAEGAGDYPAGLEVTVLSPSAIDAGKALYYASKKNIVPGAFSSPEASLRAAARRSAAKSIEAVSGDAFPLAQALLLGIVDELDGEESALFRAAGCAHVLSLSGQHLSILCALMSLLFAKALKRANLADLASAVFATAFTWLAGASPALLRSALMAIAGIALRAADRPQRGATILAAVFCLALGIAPQDARGLSFTLSYAAMAGLILLSERWETALWRLPGIAAKAFAPSLAALCATAWISLQAFGLFALGGLVASTLSGPIVLVLMWSLLASAALAPLAPFAWGALSRWHELLRAALLAVMRLGALCPSMEADTPLKAGLVGSAIAALALFVYAGPYLEYALDALKATRRESRTPGTP